MKNDKSLGSIVIVDDSTDNLDLLCRILVDHGYFVQAFTSGHDALRSIEVSRPDMVILDIMMPVLDGIEICKILKSDELTREIPVIFLSALKDTEDTIRGFKAGGIDYITKPFHQEEALTRIENQLKMSRLHAKLETLSARQEAILSAVPIIIMEVNNHKIYTWGNNAGLDFFGEDVIGKEAASYFEGDQETYDKVQPLFNGVEGIFYVESWQRRKDGKKRLLGWWCRVLKNKHGKVTGALSSAQDITDHYFHEQALKESEEKFRNVFENSTAGKSLTQTDGRIDVNHTFCNLLGYSVEEMKNKKWQELTHPGDISRDQCKINSIIAGERDSERWEKRYLHKSGNIIWVDISTVLQRDEAGKPQYFISTVIDITERKLTEESLKTSEERFRIATENLADIVYEWDLKEKIDWYGDIDKILGYPAGKFARSLQGWEDSIHPDDKDQVRRAVENQLQYGAPYIVEYRIRKMDGTYLWWSARGTVVYDSENRQNKWIGSITDITHRKCAEESLKTAYDNLEELIQERTMELTLSKKLLDETARLARVGGWELDLRTNEQVWTDMVYEIHELTRDFKPNFNNGINFYAPESMPAISEAVRAAVENGKPFDLELQIITAANNRIWVRSIGEAYRESGKTVKLGGIFQDINDRKLIEQELEKHRLHLEELVSIRTGELAAAVQNLERSNQDLEQFAYVASHDLQEPLRMISSYTQLLERRYKDKLDQDANDFIQYAVDGANRMQKLINDLLDYSRITTRGKAFGSNDAATILGHALANLSQIIMESSALVTNDDLPVIWCDQTQILRVFQNLIENAIKFRKVNESLSIHISCRDQVNYFEFIVKDNGIGIESKYHDRVFIIFQRLQSRADFPGTGIGLSICKRIVERHGGKIWFESNENQGTTFHFTLQKKGGEHNGTDKTD